ncbi:dynactin subunit 6-like [Plakobranchus ocellatus]|uniref:Dynactin subunit 6 n=1 Tax=Plakobranchus ocellatus TaxID=259542 RepID=A0AAV3XZ68_9GAST|nr:dynactin subunit 6-like [Plakobranchus ocellatus]
MASKKAGTNPNLKIAAGALVCEDCELVGDITIGSRTVIHPKARIVAESGPIVIGEYNIIEELVTITNSSKVDNGSGKVLIIGNNNVFEVGANVHAVRIGDHNVIESKAHIGPKVEIGTGCIVGAGCKLTMAEQLADNTVIYGSKCERRIQRERPPAQTLQIDFLTKILPNYHYLMKPNTQPAARASSKK